MTGRGSLAGRPRFEALPAVTHERTTRSPISRSRLLESVEASPHTDRCCPSPLSRGNAMIQRSRAGHRTPHRRCRSIMWIFPTDPVDNAYRANAAVAALPGRAVAALRVGGPSRAWLLDDRLRSGGVVGAVAVGGRPRPRPGFRRRGLARVHSEPSSSSSLVDGQRPVQADLGCRGEREGSPHDRPEAPCRVYVRIVVPASIPVRVAVTPPW
jgi:hypothetical protein